MIENVKFENAEDKEVWVSLAEIPCSNPPYQKNFAPQITNTVIEYVLIHDNGMARFSHSIEFNGTVVSEGVTVDSLGANLPYKASEIPNMVKAVYDSTNKVINPYIKLPRAHDHVIANSNSTGIYQIVPKFAESLTPYNTIGSKPSYNTGAITSSGTWGVTTLENIPGTYSGIFTETRYQGILFVGTWGENSCRAIPYIVHGDALYFNDTATSNKVTAELTGNKITFTSPISRPMSSVTFY